VHEPRKFLPDADFASAIATARLVYILTRYMVAYSDAGYKDPVRERSWKLK
jgi:hypothetical protein